MRLSESFRQAIEKTLEEHPELATEHGTEEAKSLIAQEIARKHPEFLDSSNPADMLMRLLAESDSSGEAS